MKNRVLTFVIGVLVGAIIATAGFLIYTKSVASSNMLPMRGQRNGMMQGNGMRPSERMDNQNGRTGMPREQM